MLLNTSNLFFNSRINAFGKSEYKKIVNGKVLIHQSWRHAVLIIDCFWFYCRQTTSSKCDSNQANHNDLIAVHSIIKALQTMMSSHSMTNLLSQWCVKLLVLNLLFRFTSLSSYLSTISTFWSHFSLSNSLTTTFFLFFGRCFGNRPISAAKINIRKPSKIQPSHQAPALTNSKSYFLQTFPFIFG